jgi:hypothetical protein
VTSQSSGNPSLIVDEFLTFIAEAHHFPVLKALHGNAHWLHAFVAQQHDIGPMNRRFTFNDPTLPIGSGGPLMPLNDVDVLNENARFLPVNLKNLADFTVIFSGNDFNLVVLLQMTFSLDHGYRSPQGQNLL